MYTYAHRFDRAYACRLFVERANTGIILKNQTNEVYLEIIFFLNPNALLFRMRKRLARPK